MSIDESNWNEDTVDVVAGAIKGSFTDKVKEESIQAFIDQAKADNLTRREVSKQVEETKTALTDFIKDLKPSAYKKELLNEILNCMFEIFDSAAERFGVYDIILPILLEDGAQVPTYAHGTDAAADLYAAENVIIPAHSFSNMVRSGVHIALPEGWVAFILPRSSIGFKTPLRLSNSMGVIDAGYRGPLGILYDNLSDSDYTINKGDRIAQLLIRPNYQFKPKIVDKLDETERGETGFGASGK